MRILRRVVSKEEPAVHTHQQPSQGRLSGALDMLLQQLRTLLSDRAFGSAPFFVIKVLKSFALDDGGGDGFREECCVPVLSDDFSWKIGSWRSRTTWAPATGRSLLVQMPHLRFLLPLERSPHWTCKTSRAPRREWTWRQRKPCSVEGIEWQSRAVKVRKSWRPFSVQRMLTPPFDLVRSLKRCNKLALTSEQQISRHICCVIYYSHVYRDHSYFSLTRQ